MGLQEQLLEDMKSAMREKDDLRKDAIRMVRAAIQNAEIAKMAPLDETEVLSLITREVKQRREALDMFVQGGRQDLVEKEAKQIEILEAYLPKQLSQAEIEALAQEVIGETGATGMGQMGPVMRAMMERIRGQADGKAVNEIVRKLLSGGE